ncbi:long-chain fatty acid--CoA ligase [Frankia sp. Cj5]|uniref:AMP-dependent synthetase/ligase n=1 Tax=Frankia sp. Cj5 TaxID=2880978 RepID=UPI001EF67F67|nr:long-chain fatty acid--CoA ligase [Frankia sp. Cj5]
MPGGATPPHGQGLADMAFDRKRLEPDRPILSRRTATGWQDVTLAGFGHDVLRVAKGLLAGGVAAQDRIGVLGHTCYEWVVADFAIWTIGAVTVPIYPTSSEYQVGHIIRDAGVSGCFVEEPERLDMLGKGGLGVPADRRWLLGGSFDDLADRGGSVPDEMVTGRRRAVRADDLATIVYTSGTTGPPKGCMLTHGNMFAAAVNVVEQLGVVFSGSDPEPASTLLFLPLSHVFGRVTQLGCLWAGVRTGHLASPADLLAVMPSFRPTFLIAVPYALEKIRKNARQLAGVDLSAVDYRAAERTAIHEGKVRRGHALADPALRAGQPVFDRLVFRPLRAAFGGRLRHIVCGGAFLDPSTAEFMTGLGVEIFGAYGLTEASTAVSINAPGANRPGSVGRPLPGTTVAISDDGEVLVRGPQVSAGYWPPPVERAAPDDDWLATGDLGRLDDDGYLYIIGRRKEIIITNGGKNVSPAPLEDRIRLHPLVSNCMVVGDERPFVTALVTVDRTAVRTWADRLGLLLADDSWYADERLRAELQPAVDAANELVSRAESIRKIVVLPIDFSIADGHLTPSLKLRRDVIVARFDKEIEQMYAG